MSKSQVYLLLFLIVAAGAFQRFWGTVHGSFAFTYDVGRDLLAIQKMIETQKISLLGPPMGIEGLFYGPWWYLFLAIPFLASGGDPYWVVFSITVLGLTIIPLAYFLGKEIGDNLLGLFFALLVALSAPLVSFSNQIWNPDLLPPFMFASLAIFYFLSKGKFKNIFWWLLLGWLTALTFEMEASFGFFFVLAIFLVIFIQAFQEKKWRKLAIFISGLFTIELPRIIFESRHNFLQTKSLINAIKLGSQNEQSIWEKLGDNTFLFWQNWSETLGAQNIFISALSLSFTFFVLFFFWGRLEKVNKFFAKTLLLILVLIFLGFTLYPRSLWLHYFVGLPLIYLFLFLLATLVVFKKFGKRKILILLLFLFILLNARIVGTYRSIKQPFFEGDAAVYRNQIKVLDKLYQDADGAKFNYVAYTPPLYTYTWDYLFGWYGNQKYGHKPDGETTKLFYLIIEPDFEHPERLTDWLKLRERDGKFVKKETVAGGIILEKRIR